MNYAILTALRELAILILVYVVFGWLGVAISFVLMYILNFLAFILPDAGLLILRRLEHK